MSIQAPKGTRDFYPAEMAVRNWVVDHWRRVSLRNGFEEYDGPIFELLDLYRAKSGDGIVSELFHFTDRGDRELAIRPEMTPTLARMIAKKANALPRPIKWFSVPRLCRAERPQRGRLREFFQWNIDIVGSDDALADAECLYVAIDFFRQIGLTPDDMVMKINSRSLLASLLTARGFSEERHEAIYTVLDKRDKIPTEAFTELLDKVTDDQDELSLLLAIGQARGEDGLAELEELGKNDEQAATEMARLREVLRLLGVMGMAEYCTFDMGVVRGLAYYTGVVFEGFGKGSFQRAICGGGRYDKLLEILGGPPMSGIGFGTSDVVILEMLHELGRLPEEATRTGSVDYFVIDADRELFDEALSLVARLREMGYSAAFSSKRQNVGKQFKQASNAGARRAVILGEEFRARRAVMVKDMASGDQREIAMETFLQSPEA